MEKVVMDEESPRTFAEVVTYAAGNAELVKEFNRLTGCKLGQSARRSGLERMIDEAAGFIGETAEDMQMFTLFVWECVWCRLPREE